MTRVAIYARYSSENQNDRSLNDQISDCQRYAMAQGWQVVEVFSDAALSGSSDNRPGYQSMLSAAKTGRFDVLLAESLDRLSRRLADTAHLYDDLSFNQVRIVTKDQGEITKMHVAMLGMVAEQFISDLRTKTRRGQRGRIEAGRSAGGLAFGYTVLPDGDRVIEEVEAETVRRIFRDYAAGVGPRELAASLNSERIPGPGGRPWKDTTIRGQRERGTGLLNNELYVGRLVWGRTEYRKNPSTGKRVARTIHQSELVIKERPDLRIVSDDLWQAVRRRQEASFHAMPRDNNGNALNRLHRKTHLLSGLIRCGVCHGPMAITAKGRYGCSTYRANRGCSNSQTIPREHVEERVLCGLKQRLFNSELVGEFIDEFQKQVQRTRKQQIDAVKRSQSRLKELDSMIEKLVDTIAAGLSSPSVLDRLTMLEREKADPRQPHGRGAAQDVHAGDGMGMADGQPRAGVPSAHRTCARAVPVARELTRLAAVLDAAEDQRAAAIIRMCMLTGARVGEVRTARFEQFNLDYAIWSKPASTTKQRKIHRVPISQDVAAIVRLRQQAVPSGNPWLFPGDTVGQPVREIRRFWAKVQKDAELADVRIHDLRHTFASLLVSGGASLEMIGKLLGHSQMQTTQRYAHLMDSPLRAGVDTVASLLRPRPRLVHDAAQEEADLPKSA
jgi:site-specific DNA recombinase